MAMPLTTAAGVQNGGVGVMSGPAIGQQMEMDQNGTVNRLKSSSPIRIFLFFHKAIRAELDGLHRAAMSFATNSNGSSCNCNSDIKPLLQRYRFFRSIYKHHCNAEDEVSWRINYVFLVKYWIFKLNICVFMFLCLNSVFFGVINAEIYI